MHQSIDSLRAVQVTILPFSKSISIVSFINRINISSSYHHLISTLCTLFFIHSQETFFLSCSVEKMGGTVLIPQSTIEDTITSCIPPRNTQGPVTHIICPYLKSGQRSRLQHLLGDYSVALLSTNWIYSCIDQYAYISQNTSNIWNSVLFTPSVE